MLLHTHVQNIHADNCMADLVNMCTCRLHCNKQSSEQYSYSLPSGPCIQWGCAIAPVCIPLATGLLTTTGIATALTGPVSFELAGPVRPCISPSFPCRTRPAAPLVVEEPPPTTRRCSWVTPTFSGLLGNPGQLRRSECLPTQRVVSRRIAEHAPIACTGPLARTRRSSRGSSHDRHPFLDIGNAWGSHAGVPKPETITNPLASFWDTSFSPYHVGS